ncbi:MAG: cob(I)yrinic acid a,c-diamide adenosyltransferase [Dehalococcoidia bacterium]|nr:MAG: cob(I)yrinic acid a,c-diamide adenosyltransferase [Dehalococcoidia bacterium]
MTDEPFTKGLVEIFTGSGKGKTSTALGMVLRALGHGFRVHIIFFMKGNYPYGERNMLPQLTNVSFQSFGHEQFVDPQNVKAEEREQAGEALQAARSAIASSKFDLVVLDEVNVAVAWKLIEVEDLLKLIDEKPQNVELILTGRYADQRLIERADLVTEMVEIKHPYQKGIKARKGIEY